MRILKSLEDTNITVECKCDQYIFNSISDTKRKQFDESKSSIQLITERADFFSLALIHWTVIAGNRSLKLCVNDRNCMHRVQGVTRDPSVAAS